MIKILEKLPKFVGHIYALLLIGFGWIIFSFTDAAAGIECFVALFGAGCESFTSPAVTYQVLRGLPLIIIGAIGATPYPKKLWDKLCTVDWTSVGAIRVDGREEPIVMSSESLSTRGKIFSVVGLLGSFAVLMLSVAYLVDSTFSPFLYFIF